MKSILDNWHDLLPQVLELAGIGTWEMIAVPEGVRMRFSSSVYTLFGYTEGELEGRWDLFLDQACHPNSRQGLQESIASAMASPGQVFHYEFQIWSKHTEHWRWVYAFGKALPGESTGEFRILGCVQDIHEIRSTQKALERSQQEALQTVELQKAVLEQQVRDQTTLLRDIQGRMDSILDATSPVDAAPSPFVKTATTDVYDNVDTSFVESLHKAFDIITEKMSWYKAVIDSIHFPISVTDMAGRWMYLNAPGLEAIGADSLKSVFGQPARRWSSQGEDLGSPEDNQRLFSLYHKQLKRFFQGQESDLFDSENLLIGHIETMQDVSKVHEADERTRLMLETMPFGCSFWNRDGKILDCNPAMLSLLGLPNKKAYIENFDSFSPEYQPNGEQSAKRSMENIRAAFETGYSRFEWLHQTLSGERIPSEITLVRIAWRDDYVLVGYMSDLRRLEAARQERDKERLLLKNILDSSPVCMMILVGGKVRFVTPYTHEFLGISEGDAISEFHTSQVEVAQIQEELYRNRVLNWRPITMPSVSGGVRDMLGNAFYTEYYGEEGLVLWLVDITDMREKERQLLLARDAAEESTRAKSEFLANMSHEIRTPMNAILGMTHLIQRTPLSPKQRDYMDKAEQSSKALLRIINDILDFSKIEAGKLEMERLSFSVENVMRGVTAVIGEAAKEKGLELLLSIPPEMPLKVEGDPVRLHQVLLNLAGNAIKFTSKGNITLGASVLNSAEDEVVLGFSVSDTGIGMSQAQIAGLFSPFSQADTSTTRQYGGTGLGLAISKRLVELMDGAIWCESLPGVGSTFRFTTRFGLVEAAPAYSAAFFANMEVLLLGDNFEAITLLRPMLQSMGCQVSAAFGLEQGVALLQRPAGFDMMIMDWRNAADQAPEAMTYLKEKTGKELPLTLLAIPEVAVEAIEKVKSLDIAHILSKPITPSSLFDGIGGLIDGSGKLTAAAPIADVSENAETAIEELAPFKGAKILLAEDNAINQMVARELLEIGGMVTDIAENGREAVKKVIEGDYALVLMDIQMPEMDGLEATHAIRSLERFTTLPIIAMTAHAMHGDREKSLRAGMNDHVTKPIDATELYKTLAHWLPRP